MADEQEKTQEPTEKKIEDAKKEGNVPKSMDLAGFVALLIATIAVIASFSFIFSNIKDLFRYYYSFFGADLSLPRLYSIGFTSIKEILIASLPIAVIVAFAGSIGYLIQFGFIFTVKPLIPDLKKIDPIKGLKNLFSMQKLIEGIKITAKVAVSFVVGFYVFVYFTKELPLVTTFSFTHQLSWLSQKAIIIAVIMLIVFFIFAVIDTIITRYHHFKKLRMSIQEVKDELKNIIGNPEVKARIRKIQSQMSRQKMEEGIKESTSLITNPTHYAVAIAYDPKKYPVPVCMAKGADLMAQRLRELARENGVIIYEDPPLARELYRVTKIGEPIPENLWEATAKVLKFVLDAKGMDSF